MEMRLRSAVAVLLVLSLQLLYGGGSSDAEQGTVNREEDVRSEARVIQARRIREAEQQPNRYWSRQQQQQQEQFGSKAGWPEPGGYPSGMTSQQPQFPQWPPWPWEPGSPPARSLAPSGAPAPAPAGANPAPLPRRAPGRPAHSITLPPQPAAAADGGGAAVPAAAGAAAEAKRAGGARPIYVIAAAGASFVAAMSAALFVLCYRSSKVVTVRPWATGLSGQLQKAFVTGVPALKRSELEVACEDFSNVIGSVSDYTMYKGTLSSGVEIAVVSTTKNSGKEWSKHCEAQFRKKITSLSRVNHKNFVNLLGYCEEEQPFTRMMVFEYAPNGTLFEHLHVREDGHLDWATRLRVAVGIAYCLEHMHQLSPPEILRTLDASTVYLTDDFAAKIADVSFCGESAAAAAEEEAGQLRSPALCGREGVVYGYGMLLLETMSGRFTASEGGLLEGWAASFLRGERRLRDVMDPALGASFPADTVDRLDGVVRSCTDREPRRRPSMAEVARRLREITAMPPDAATPKVSPLWWAELEIISTEAT